MTILCRTTSRESANSQFLQRYAIKYQIDSSVSSAIASRLEQAWLDHVKIGEAVANTQSCLALEVPSHFYGDDEERQHIEALLRTGDAEKVASVWPQSSMDRVKAIKTHYQESMISESFEESFRREAKRYIDGLRRTQVNLPLQHAAIVPALDFPSYSTEGIFKEDGKIAIRRRDMDSFQQILHRESRERAIDVGAMVYNSIASATKANIDACTAFAKQDVEIHLLPMPYVARPVQRHVYIKQPAVTPSLHIDGSDLAAFLSDEIVCPEGHNATAQRTPWQKIQEPELDAKLEWSPSSKRRIILRKFPRDMYTGKRSIPLLDPPHCLIGTVDIFKLKQLSSKLKTVPLKATEVAKSNAEKQLCGQETVGVDPRIVATAKRTLQCVQNEATSVAAVEPDWTLIKTPRDKLANTYVKLEREGTIHELRNHMYEPFFALSTYSSTFRCVQQQFDEAHRRIQDLEEEARTPRQVAFIKMPMDRVVVIEDGLDDGDKITNGSVARQAPKTDPASSSQADSVVAAAFSDERAEPIAPTSQSSEPARFDVAENLHFFEYEDDNEQQVLFRGAFDDEGTLSPISQKRLGQPAQTRIQVALTTAGQAAHSLESIQGSSQDIKVKQESPEEDELISSSEEGGNGFTGVAKAAKGVFP